MALRTRYGYNCQKVNYGYVGNVLPVGFVEVAPGETVEGTVSVDTWSRPTTRNMLNRAYMDAYAFHVPYRLLRSEWPDFITGKVATNPLIQTLTPVSRFFESRNAISADGTTFTQLSEANRRAYTLVMCKFFFRRDLWDRETYPNLTAVENAWQRPSTWEVLPQVEDDDLGVAIGSTTETLRSALAQDEFQKLRRFYGERYVDYLAAMGVSTGWSVLEEPELIGMVHADWKFVAKESSYQGTETALGETKGFFRSGIKVPVKRTFCAEHGLIVVVVCSRFDPFFTNSAVSPHLVKTSRSQFWSPEFAVEKKETWPGVAFHPETDPAADGVRILPKFEDYRRGHNENANMSVNADWMGAVVPQPDPKYQVADFDAVFSDIPVDLLSGYHYQATADWRLIRLSPVPKHGARIPLA